MAACSSGAGAVEVQMERPAEHETRTMMGDGVLRPGEQVASVPSAGAEHDAPF